MDTIRDGADDGGTDWLIRAAERIYEKYYVTAGLRCTLTWSLDGPSPLEPTWSLTELPETYS